MNAEDQYHTVWELLETCKSARADVNKLKCLCFVLPKRLQLCTRCQALAKFATMRRKLEGLKEVLREEAKHGTGSN